MPNLTFALAICIACLLMKPRLHQQICHPLLLACLPPPSGGGFKPTRFRRPTLSKPAQDSGPPDSDQPCPGRGINRVAGSRRESATVPSLPATLLGAPKDSAPTTKPPKTTPNPSDKHCIYRTPTCTPVWRRRYHTICSRGLLRSQPITSQSQPTTESQPNLPNRVIEDPTTALPSFRSLTGDRKTTWRSSPFVAPPSPSLQPLLKQLPRLLRRADWEWSHPTRSAQQHRPRPRKRPPFHSNSMGKP